MFKFLSKYFFCLSLLFIVGCKKKLQLNNNSFEAFNSFKCEAKFYDIPIPIHAVSISSNVSENSYSYFVNSKIEDLIFFYDTEMENFGWKKFVEFSSFEKLLIFFKPNDRHVSISIRPDPKNKKINVVILIKNC